MENLVRKTTKVDRKVAIEVLAMLKSRKGGWSISVGNKSKPIRLTRGVERLLTQIFSLMANGKSIAVLASEMEVSTQEAAELLNFSRPFVVKLLEEGKIPFKKVGSHRRILLADVLFYKKQFEKRQDAALNFLVQQAQDLKLGYQ